MSQTDSHPELSVILPTYNARSCVRQAVAELAAFLDAQGVRYELIVVNDGSTDGTDGVLAQCAQEFEHLRALGYEANAGKGHAVRKGVEEARGDYVIFTDIDLTYRPPELMKILSRLKAGCDVAIASRSHPDSVAAMPSSQMARFYIRYLVGRIFNFLVRLFLLPRLGDTQAGLKGFSREAATEIFQTLSVQRYCFDVELLLIARTLSLRVEEVPIECTYVAESGAMRLGTASAEMLMDLLRLRLRRGRKS